jgi:tetrahydromethanopterin S-methyltransferase subunit A
MGGLAPAANPGNDEKLRLACDNMAEVVMGEADLKDVPRIRDAILENVSRMPGAFNEVLKIAGLAEAGALSEEEVTPSPKPRTLYDVLDLKSQTLNPEAFILNPKP